MTKRGRPRVLADHQKRRTVCAMISVGAGFEAAARHVGCSVWTIRREAERDEEFAERLREAETAAELMPLQMMRKAAGTQWRAAAWLLERACPERFARRGPETVSTGEVKSLLDEVVTIVADECADGTERQRIFRRLNRMQEARFGESRAALQGIPEPKSPLQQIIDEADRRQQQAVASIVNEVRRKEQAWLRPGRGATANGRVADSVPVDDGESEWPSESEVLHSVRDICQRKFAERQSTPTPRESGNLGPTADDGSVE